MHGTPQFCTAHQVLRAVHEPLSSLLDTRRGVQIVCMEMCWPQVHESVANSGYSQTNGILDYTISHKCNSAQSKENFMSSSFQISTDPIYSSSHHHNPKIGYNGPSKLAKRDTPARDKWTDGSIIKENSLHVEYFKRPDKFLFVGAISLRKLRYWKLSLLISFRREMCNFQVRKITLFPELSFKNSYDVRIYSISGQIRPLKQLESKCPHFDKPIPATYPNLEC